MTNLCTKPTFPSLRVLACAAATFATVLAASSAQTAAAQTAAAQTTLTRPQPRITSPISTSSRFSLAGSRIPQAVSANDIGAVAPSLQLQGVTLVFSRSAAQQADLQTLIAAQQDPTSSLYHQWLTPAQFGARFGLADSDIAAVQTWLQQQGFTVGAVSNSRDRISFSGTAGQVESAFGAPIHYFRSSDAADSSTHFAPASDLSLPSALSSTVMSVANLSNFRPRSHALLKNTDPRFTSSSTGNHFLTPGDVVTIYDVKPAYSAGFTGAGQSITIIGQTNIIASDITAFQTAAGITPKLPNLYLVTGSGTSTVFTGDESESDLDLEYSSSIATGATINFVYTGSNTNYGAFDSLQYAVDTKLGNIISSSYGACEIALSMAGFGEIENILAQAATQGQTVISAAGDQGSTDCYADTGLTSTQRQALSVDYPASSNFVTAMGGSEFTAAAVAAGTNTYFAAAPSSTTDAVSSALSYIPEQVWNDDIATSNLSSGGGGVSIFSLRPPWQAGAPGISSSTYRTLPDISLDSSPNNAGYAYCTSDTTAYSKGQAGSCTSGFRDSVTGDLTLAGGTSFAAPIFAAMLSLINQAKAPSGQGLINPTLYSLASNSTTYASAFHDITSGGNQCLAGTTFCSTAGTGSYAAGTGYDLASGLGSIDLNNLLTAWPKVTATTASFSLAATSPTIKAGTNGTATVTVTPSNGYTGTVYFSLSSLSGTLNYICYSAPNATVTGAAAVPVTVTIYTSVSSCASGASPLTVHGSGSAVSSNHSPARSPWRQAPLPAAIAGLVLALGLSRRSRRLRGLSLALFALAALGAAAGLSGCSSSATSTAPTTGGGGTTGGSTTGVTPAGIYTITVAGYDKSNSAITASTTLTLTIN